MASVIAENLVETTSDGKFTGKPLEHIKSLIGEGVTTGTTPPTDAPAGAVPTKTANGVEWKAPVRGIDSIKPVNSSLALVTYTDGQTQTLPISAKMEWSKDAQAEAQGFWIVVSENEPTATTYRTASGKVVPIIWEKPVTQLAPVIPQEPVWDHLTGTVHVPELTGVEYRLGGKIIPPNTLYKVSATFPFTAVVEAVAKTGFFLPNAFRWEHRFPDVTRRVLWASDNFSTDGKTRAFDMAAGGSAAVVPRWEVRTGVVATTNPYFAASSGVLTPEATGIDNTWLFARVNDEDIRLEFEVLEVGQTSSAEAVFSVGARASANEIGVVTGGFSLELGGKAVAVARNQNGMGELSGIPGAPRLTQLTGRWVIELIGQTVTIIDPTGKQHNGVLADSLAQQANRSAVYVRLYKGAAGARIDNFRIFTYQY